jgi:hypothetical protein
MIYECISLELEATAATIKCMVSTTAGQLRWYLHRGRIDVFVHIEDAVISLYLNAGSAAAGGCWFQM